MKAAAGALLLVLCPGTKADAAVVRLSGKVTNAAGAVLKDVVLSLKNSATSAKTGSDGKFLLTSGSTGVLAKASSGVLPVAFEVKGAALVVIAGSVDVEGWIEVLSANGKKTLATPALGRGSSRSVGLSAFSQGLNIVRIGRGDGAVLCSVLRLDDRLMLAGSSVQGEGNGLSARISAAVAIDTLVAKKAGYADRKLPIAAYIDSNLVLAMDSSVSGTCPQPKAGSSKANPIFTDVYTADPGVMVDNCTFYIQCGHDQGTGGFDLREWYLLKSTDMVNWTRTTPMNLKTFAWTNANAWAGQMIKARNGKYYWYVPINDIVHSQDRMAIGVAVADSPEGPWKDALGKPLINDSLEMSTWGITNIDQTPHTIDPTVFIDDDGQAYLQYGGFWKMITVKLNPDMVTLSGKLTETTPYDYFESPYLVKRNGIYYEIYARGAANPTTIDYATSNSPMGPWTHKGTILAAMPKVAGQDEPTNHAGVAEFAGQWYIVYHLSNGPNGGGTYRREVAIDKLTFKADGTIEPVTPSATLSF